MTIGNIEVFFTYESMRAQLNLIVVQEVLQALGLDLLILLLMHLVRKSLIDKRHAVNARLVLEATQTRLMESERQTERGQSR